MQDAIAIAIVAACLAWIGLRAWRALSGSARKGSCGCDECPATKAASTRKIGTSTQAR